MARQHQKGLAFLETDTASGPAIPLANAPLTVQDAHQRTSSFMTLAAAVRQCAKCPRMRDRARVLGMGNGDITARILFVAEAPGRLGAERTGVPLSGDQTGRNFERLLAAVRMSRDDVFVTNAVLCNPQTPSGCNDKPTTAEVKNCSRFLASTIDLIAPDLVVALGVAALSALGRIAPHELTLRSHLATPTPWYNRLLVPLYHPSPRTRVFRSFEEQASDLANALAPLRTSITNSRTGLIGKQA